MNTRSKYTMLLALLLALLLLTACVRVAQQKPAAQATEAPAATKAPAEQPQEGAVPGTVTVSTVDELLAALAPDTTIVLKEGQYDLGSASDYGSETSKEYYSWELVMGGAQLNLFDLTGLRLVSEGQVSIVARPRYAEVLSFSNCWDLQLEGLTLGHTQAPEGCVGGVLSLTDCEGVTLENCRLYGCGVLGVNAVDCGAVTLRSTQIDSCSNGAVFASACRDMRLEDCKICDCGLSKNGAAGDMFFLDRCQGFALVNCEITGNRAETLIQNSWGEQVYLLGCRVEQNRFMNAVFQLQGRSVTVDKCSFALRTGERYYPQIGSLFAKTPAGETLTAEALNAMQQARAQYDGPTEETDLPQRPEPTGEPVEVHAATADELIAAIGPNTTILLDEGVYDLSAASLYAGETNDYFGWEEDYDGYTLKILGVRGLTIVGAGKGKTQIVTSPRYAAVFRFQFCDDVTLRGVTAGHTEAPGYCTGNVLDFDSCENVKLEDCGLFGCGMLGVWASNCTTFTARDSEIYECTSGAADFANCAEVSFEGCSIHDCEYNEITLVDCEATWDGQLLVNGIHEFQGATYLGEMVFEAN